MNYKAFMNLIIVAVISLALVMPMVPNGEIRSDEGEGNGIMAETQPTTRVQYGGDWILSYDEKETLNDANNPDVAFAPDGTIHAVWDEPFEGLDGKIPPELRKTEIHYSMSQDGGASWTGEFEDIMISPFTQEVRAPPEENATNPSVTIDNKGIIHVIWTELV